MCQFTEKAIRSFAHWHISTFVFLWPDFSTKPGKSFYMTNRKIVAGVLTGIAAGVAISLFLYTKKGKQTGKTLWKKGSRLTDDIKGKFNDFIDQVQDKAKGILK
jgi:hypothetical protein